jgi:hypothetical protein
MKRVSVLLACLMCLLFLSAGVQAFAAPVGINIALANNPISQALYRFAA